VVPLTTGFRVPEAVVALANRLLPALAVDVPPRSLRRDGWLAVHDVPDPLAATAAAVRAALESPGSVGVIAPDARIPAVAAALMAEGIVAGHTGDEKEERVTVLPASLAKGLEYDVLVLEPAEIVSAEPRGLHRLYVVLTRAVSSLTVLHAQPLPEPIAGPRG
jgi:hypothetical protein